MANVVALALSYIETGFELPSHPPGGTVATTADVRNTADVLGGHYDEAVQQVADLIKDEQIRYVSTAELLGGGIGIWRLQTSELLAWTDGFVRVDEWEPDHWLQAAPIGDGECVVYPENRSADGRLQLVAGDQVRSGVTAVRVIDATFGDLPRLLTDDCDAALQTQAAQPGHCESRLCVDFDCQPKWCGDKGVKRAIGCWCV